MRCRWIMVALALLSGSLPGIFVDYAGTIDADGRARASLRIPPKRELIGLRIHSAFLTLEPSFPAGVKSVSNTYTLPISR